MAVAAAAGAGSADAPVAMGAHRRQGGASAARRRGRRPRVPGEVASEKLVAWLTPSERAALKAASDEAGLSPAALVREAVNEYVADFSERRVFSGGGNSEADAD